MLTARENYAGLIGAVKLPTNSTCLETWRYKSTEWLLGTNSLEREYILRCSNMEEHT